MEKVIESFKESMGRLATGVNVVTTEIDNRPWGTTVSACCSISMDPPLLLISLFSDKVSTKSIDEQQRFGVSILAQDQQHVAKAGARSKVPKFFEDFIDFNTDGNTYKLNNVLAHVHCKVYDKIIAGDHTIFLGLVEEVDLGDSNEPLLHFNRKFGSFDSELIKKYA